MSSRLPSPPIEPSFEPEELRDRPGLLKLDLFCRGLRLDPSCHVVEDGGRPVLRTRAGLGSGLELVLPGDLWTNVPVTESFARRSPYTLHHADGSYHLRRHGREVTEVRLAPRPSWYERTTTTGKPMTKVGTLQGTYLAVFPTRVCDFWKDDENCRFCSVGLNLGADDAPEKRVDEVVEVVRTAVEESNITYVDFNTGHYEGETYLDDLEPYLRRVKEETGVLVGVQTPPHHDHSRWDRLREIGVNRVSFCFEIFDPDRFVEVCPGKHRTYGLQHYLDAVEYCASLGARGPRGEPWVVNGEIIVGLEPVQSSLAAVEWITSVGAVPTVCVFRPLRGTALSAHPPPRTEEVLPVFAHMYEACVERGLPIGLAPNVHVSLVLLPEEARTLVENPGRFRWAEWKRRWLSKLVAHRVYRRRDRAMGGLLPFRVGAKEIDGNP